MRRCFIIGKFNQELRQYNKKSFENTCKKIGKILAENDYSLNVCSLFEDSADYWILRGFSQSEQINLFPVKLYHPNKENIENEIDNKLNNEFFDLNIKKIPCIAADNYSWLLCQLQALDECDLVISIGGKYEGSANMLLLLAESKGKNILPFSFFGGAAEKLFIRKQFELKDRLGKNIDVLNKKTKINELNKVFQENHYKDFGDLKCFISYPKLRPYEADFIETVLRRRNIEVYRDERDFGTGKNIEKEIQEWVSKSNTFIATWCKEYACSPWCFDELELALNLHEEGKMNIWIFNSDGTRIIPKRARGLKIYDVKNRTELNGELLDLIKKSLIRK